MTRHTLISFIKSFVRIFGCIIGFYNILAVPFLFLIAEIIGIIEELDQ